MKHRSNVGIILILVAVLALMVIVAHAQAPQALSELEKYRIENLNLKQQLAGTLKTLAETQGTLGQCQAQINAGVVRQDAAALKADLEGARPGWVWNFEKQQFEKKGDEKKDPPK